MCKRGWIGLLLLTVALGAGAHDGQGLDSILMPRQVEEALAEAYGEHGAAPDVVPRLLQEGVAQAGVPGASAIGGGLGAFLPAGGYGEAAGPGAYGLNDGLISTSGSEAPIALPLLVAPPGQSEPSTQATSGAAATAQRWLLGTVLAAAAALAL